MDGSAPSAKAAETARSVGAPEGVREGLRAHGTAAAGIVAGEADNNFGVAGVCPSCEVMLLRARDFDRAHSVLPKLAEAVRYAVAQGANVVSVSDGRFAPDVLPEVDSEIRAALAEAEAQGVVVVASAGNDRNLGVRLPAAYPTVLAVASVGPSWGPSSTTSHGPNVDVAAPGECIHTLSPNGETRCFEGTSAAAPIVAALAALLVAAHPNWDPGHIRSHIENTARPVKLDGASELEGRLGAGVVDFAAALAAPTS